MKVVVGLIHNQKKEFLITQRSLEQSHGGCWEFPGGKVNPDELPESALMREIKEEVGLVLNDFIFLDTIHHTYDTKRIELDVFLVSGFSGEASCLERQLGLQWLKLADMKGLPFPEANKKIIKCFEKMSKVSS